MPPIVLRNAIVRCIKTTIRDFNARLYHQSPHLLLQTLEWYSCLNTVLENLLIKSHFPTFVSCLFIFFSYLFIFSIFICLCQSFVLFTIWIFARKTKAKKSIFFARKCDIFWRFQTYVDIKVSLDSPLPIILKLCPEVCVSNHRWGAVQWSSYEYAHAGSENMNTLPLFHMDT